MLRFTHYITLNMKFYRWNFILFVEPSSNRLLDAICRAKNSANQKGTKFKHDSAAVNNLKGTVFGGDTSTVLDTS